MVRLVFVTIFSVLAGMNHADSQGMKSILDNEVNPGETLMEFDNRSKEIIGNYYIDDNWKKCNIELKSGILIKNQLVRYDLEYDLLEVKLADELKVIPLRKIKYYRIIDQGDSNLFQNCDSYSFEDGTPLSGICRVIAGGPCGAIVKYTYVVKEATYVPALDMGTQDEKIIHKEHIFLTKQGTIYKLPGKKKAFYSFFINPNSDIKSYMKQHHLKYKDPDDLAEILTFVNQNDRQ